MKQISLFICFFLCSMLLFAEDGNRLWLRYERLPETIANDYSKQIQFLSSANSETGKIIGKEFREAFEAMTGKQLFFSKTFRQKNSVCFEIDKQIEKGYVIQPKTVKGGTYIAVSAPDNENLLYGMFHLLRLMQTQADISNLNIREIPRYERRILNHWDNLDGSIERGYAGHSLWQWDELPQTLSPRYEAYARANASIGINGTVLNNVNANPLILSPEYLVKVKALADVFRPYGLKVYLSVNFSSPKELGGLPDSDPLNKEVVQWWNDKVREVYALIPDFGGFLVKANSEGLPGPQDYGRTHADGANMLADALKPYKGIVMWRAFVYSPSKEDRAKQAVLEFTPLDGQFRDNVIIQIKNGPIDFQPREPFSPLFGALRKTQEMLEFQITQEYLGFSNHLVYLAPLFKETLDNDTYSDGQGSTVTKITDGTLRPAQITAIAGVANTGDNANWCGHSFAQANWYAFGRLAWNPDLASEQIANEWLKMTFTPNPEFIDPVKKLMLSSRETCVDYMMPLGLHHIFAFNHHYGPEPWGDMPGGRLDWMPWYYHNADTVGVGFDRTVTGSDAVSQYFPPLNAIYNDIARCPENLLLWFHHVPWEYPMKNGRSLWDNLCYRYDEGVRQVREYQKIWDRMEPYVDAQRFKEVQSKLRIQAHDAVWWKDACLLYFQTFSKRPIPYDIERPVHELEDLKKIRIEP
jgi:alpha-glucuronidase